MNRHSDIHELLEDVEQNIQLLVEQIESSKSDEEIDKLSGPKLKSVMEHLRSCLEYCAQDLSEIVLGKSSGKVYFPYGKNEQDFKSSLGRNLKGLPVNYSSIVERIQPHSCGENWLCDLCDFTNHNKHNALQKQARQNLGMPTTKVGNIVHSTGGSQVTIGQLFVNGKLMNPNGPLEINDSRKAKDISEDLQNLIKVERTYGNVSFVDSSTGLNLIDLMLKSKSEIAKFVDNLYRELEANK